MDNLYRERRDCLCLPVSVRVKISCFYDKDT